MKEIFNSNDMDEAYIRGLKDGQSLRSVLTDLRTVSEENNILRRENRLLKKAVATNWRYFVATHLFGLDYDDLGEIEKYTVNQEVDKMMGRINTHKDDDEIPIVWWTI